MARVFAITTTATNFRLDAQGQAETTFRCRMPAAVPYADAQRFEPPIRLSRAG